MSASSESQFPDEIAGRVRAQANSQAAANSTRTRMQLATADLDLSTLALLHARADVFSRHACRVSLCESCLGRRRRLLPPRARREARPPQVVLWRARSDCVRVFVCGDMWRGWRMDPFLW